MIVERQVELRFGDESRAAETHTNLSAVRQDGATLWVAGDETATVERLTAETDASGAVTGYGDQRTFRLADLVPLPGDDPDEEADIEGLAQQDGWLWAIGSHSLKRRRVKPEHSDDKALRRMRQIVREDNRFILARLPLVQDADGRPIPVRQDGDRTAAVLGLKGDAITDLLVDDPHLAPFLAIPSKDNGVDVEGVAVHGDRLYVGFRGPVLRGWAVLLEIRPEVRSKDPRRLRAEKFGPDGERYRVHFLELGNLGIRDLCPFGDDLLILAGPSMGLSGPVKLVRWRGANTADAPAIVRADDLEVLGDLPHGDGEDHAEGIGVLDADSGAGPEGPPRLLVVYDAPSAARLTESGGVIADIIAVDALR